MKTLITIILTVIVTLIVTNVIDYVKTNNETPVMTEEINNMSDEEQIIYIVDKLNKSYENGDFEGITDCMTKKSANQMNGGFGLVSNILSKLLGSFTNDYLEIDSDTISDLWSAGTATFCMRFDINEIDIRDDETAYVSVNIVQYSTTENMSGEADGYLLMKRENGCWLIENIYEGNP